MNKNRDDVLDRDVAIAAKLEENGLTLKTKSRAVAALDRLVGSLLDMPTALFEGVSGKKRLSDEIHQRLSYAQLKAAEHQIETSPALGSALINDVLKDQARKQENRAGVAVEAVGAMKILFNSTDEQSKTSTSEENIQDDWMNQFVRFTEDASSEHLQQIWGRVLAGEVRKPGSFSRQTLRFIAELDTETALNCEFLARYRIGNWIFRSEQWDSGDHFLVGIDLQRLGLIEGVGGGTQREIDTVPGKPEVLAGEYWGLIFESSVVKKFNIPAIIFTRLGNQVMSLLKPGNEDENFKSLANSINKKDLKSIKIGKIVSKIEGRINLTQVTEIWPDSKSD